MKKLLSALFGAALILGACGGADDPTPTPDETPQETPEETTDTDDTAARTFDATAALASYEAGCAGCHGGDLQGGAAYEYPITGLSYEEVLAAINEGPGSMPANPRDIEGEEAENLSAWIAAQ